MKTQTWLLAILASGLLVFNSPALADGQGDTNQDHSGDSQITGTEEMHGTIVLTATNDAPTNALGVAEIESDNEDGALAATLDLKTEGLSAGDYTVLAIRQSDGSGVILGQITVGSSGDEGLSADDTNSDGGDLEGDGGSGALISEDELALPSDLSPMDIAQLVVADSTGAPVLVGDMVTPNPDSTVSFDATVEITPDGGAPGAAGTARYMSTLKKGKWKHSFLLTASNVPTNTTFTVQFNGTAAGKARSNKRGQVAIKKLPKGVSSLRSVQLTDAQGQAAAGAKF